MTFVTSLNKGNVYTIQLFYYIRAAEAVGFEPTKAYTFTDFESVSIDLSDTPPCPYLKRDLAVSSYG